MTEDSVAPVASPGAVRRVPSIPIRLLWWFGVYLAAQLPLIGYFLGSAIFSGPLFFPLGLEIPIDPYLSRLGRFWSESAAILIFAFYPVHLLLTLGFRSKKAFRILMVILTVVVLLNLAGCEQTMSGWQDR